MIAESGPKSKIVDSTGFHMCWKDTVKIQGDEKEALMHTLQEKETLGTGYTS
jgi:hypothetical protein